MIKRNKENKQIPTPLNPKCPKCLRVNTTTIMAVVNSVIDELGQLHLFFECPVCNHKEESYRTLKEK